MGKLMRMLMGMLMGMFVLAMAACTMDPQGAVNQDISTPPDRLAPISWSIGTWWCLGTYFASPFTASHSVSATFRVQPDVGNQWLDGAYQEVTSTDGSLLGIDEHLTIDRAGNGIRMFVDGNGGRFDGSLAPTATGVAFEGDYRIFTGPGVAVHVPFHETLVRGDGSVPLSSDTFSTASSIDLPVGPGGSLVPVTFETQDCHKLAR